MATYYPQSGQEEAYLRDKDDPTVRLRKATLKSWAKTLEMESRYTGCPNSTAFVLRRLADEIKELA